MPNSIEGVKSGAQTPRGRTTSINLAPKLSARGLTGLPPRHCARFSFYNADMRPWIGIALGHDNQGRWRPGRDYLYGDLAYVRAVEAAGGVPVVLPLQHDPNILIERIDALLIPGGDDFPPPPGLYPESVSFDLAPETQRDFDAALLAAALVRNLPVLGICYGAQLLALHHGGSLHHHLPTDRPDGDAHNLSDEEAGRHPIEIVPGTRLSRILGGHADPVNSLHHQAVAEPGAGMRVAARARDGVVEAIEPEASGFCLGVQWHPEKLRNSDSQALFTAFVDAGRNPDTSPASPIESR